MIFIFLHYKFIITSNIEFYFSIFPLGFNYTFSKMTRYNFPQKHNILQEMIYKRQFIKM